MDIWVVQGATGEYSDHCEWLVGWYSSEQAARDAVEALSTLSREAAKLDKQPYDNDRGRVFMEPFDPDYRKDYTGTNYGFFKVPKGSKISLSPEKIQALKQLAKESK